jgi:hypothetical protein
LYFSLERIFIPTPLFPFRAISGPSAAGICAHCLLAGRVSIAGDGGEKGPKNQELFIGRSAGLRDNNRAENARLCAMQQGIAAPVTLGVAFLLYSSAVAVFRSARLEAARSLFLNAHPLVVGTQHIRRTAAPGGPTESENWIFTQLCVKS